MLRLVAAVSVPRLFHIHHTFHDRVRTFGQWRKTVGHLSRIGGKKIPANGSSLVATEYLIVV